MHPAVKFKSSILWRSKIPTDFHILGHQIRSLLQEKVVQGTETEWLHRHSNSGWPVLESFFDSVVIPPPLPSRGDCQRLQ